MARSRAGRVTKSASQTLPVRGTQPRPLIGVRTVQTMITHFSRQETPGLAHGGDQAGRVQVFHDQFQVQPAQQHEQQQPALSTQQTQNPQAQQGPEPQVQQDQVDINPAVLAVLHQPEQGRGDQEDMAAQESQPVLDQRGEQISLHDWIDPEVPGPEVDPPEDTDG